MFVLCFKACWLSEAADDWWWTAAPVPALTVSTNWLCKCGNQHHISEKCLLQPDFGTQTSSVNRFLCVHEIIPGDLTQYRKKHIQKNL